MFSVFGLSFKKLNEASCFQVASVNFLILHYAFCILHSKRSGGSRTRFPAGKPRRLQQSTGLLPRAAFRVHFGVKAFGTQSVSVLTPILPL